jgi:hypothetical protein
MNTRPKGSVRLVMLLLGFGLFACGGPQEAVDQTTHSSESWDPCGNLPGLALDLEAAASAPALIGQEDSPTLGELGPEGAKALAAQLQPQGTFCEAAPPAAFQPILEKAQQLADQGDKAGARMLLESLLDIGSLPGGGYHLSVRIQTPGQARSFIRGLLVAAGLDLALGGDGKDFIDQANTTFSEMANGELNSASFEETLRLADEAQRLGQDDIAQRALERAQEIAAEGLDAAIEDLDPCLSNPQDLHDEITKLLLAFQTASLLGVPDTYGPGQSRYDATWSQATKALKALGGETPDECKGFSFSFSRTVSGMVTMTGEAHSCGGIRGPWLGTLNLSGTWTDFGNTGEGKGEFEFTIPEDSDEVEAIIPTSGQIHADEGCSMPFTDPLQLHVQIVGESELQLGIISTNAGTASMVCPDETLSLPSIMTVWTEEPTFVVDLERGANCP